MAKRMTEDEVRDLARKNLGLENIVNAQCGVGQLTTFNQLGFTGVLDKPDGWYLPNNHAEVAIVLEVKANNIMLGDKQVDELLKNISIVSSQYNRVVGILYNGEDIRVFMNDSEIETTKQLEKLDYYTSLFNISTINKEQIYELTARINNCLHFDFGIKNLYHRMIFTACALVAKRYDALMVRGMDYSGFHNTILNCLNKELIRDKQQNRKLGILTDVFAKIEMNLDVCSEDAKQQQHVKDLIAEFIDWVTEISNCLNSDAWRGEDVMGIFFNEFNRYKKKSEAGQVFTPEHITDFMYKILDVNKDDIVFDGCCGSGGFLVKAMSNMIQEAGGVNTDKAKAIKREQLYGIEFDKEIYALACANMLIHKDGKTNLEQMDSRTEEACKWIASKNITKILMNPPYENKYGCMTIVENMLDSVPPHTMCGFILPDKKLEKATKTQIKRILKHHRITKIIKMPEDLFFGVGVTTSIFVFETGVSQDSNEIFGCYIETDGLETVKNKGRHDVRNRWPSIEKYWVNSIKKLRDDKYGTAQWINPNEHLSYQMPEKPFEVFKEDFRKTAVDYLMFQQGIDARDFSNKLLIAAMYSSDVSRSNNSVSISMKISGNETKIGTDGWKLFRLEELFEVVKGTRLTKANMKEGSIKFVGSSAMNNGETHRISNNDHIHPANTISVCYNGSVGETFYQDEQFWASDDVNVLYPRFHMTKNIALFLCPIIKSVGRKYAFINKWKQEDMKATEIKLPCLNDGNPDWDFMESYMGDILNKSSKYVDVLSSVIF